MQHKELPLSYVFRLILFSSILILASCSYSKKDALRNEIEGKGKLLLDSSNPYLAPNKFLSEESNSSETLKGFLTHQGSPKEISYEESLFSQPRLTLFYPQRNNKYNLYYAGEDWIITGPLSLDGENINEDDPKDKNSNSLFSSENPPLISLEEAKKKAEQNYQKDNENDSKQEVSKENNNKNFKDLFHTVETKDETIEFLAHWYTKDISNATRIRNINSIPPGSKLKAGKSIRIPSYLLKTEEKPQKKDLEKFLLSLK